MKSLNSGLRTADVARRLGCSVQQVRNLERDGVLPPTTRLPSGHRRYAEIHVRFGLAYRALAAGIGPVEAKQLLAAVRRRPLAEVLGVLDAVHARLDSERRVLHAAVAAAEQIADEPITDVRPTDALTISELAEALGVRTSTLRHWDAERLVTPHRGSAREPRRYAPDDVRDARIVHQLRLAGYRIETLRTLIPELRRARHRGDLRELLQIRERALTVRSRAMLRASALLDDLLDEPS